LEKRSGIHTVPQLFIDKKFIGGHDVVKRLDERGVLKQLLQQANVLRTGNGCA
jgi:glutaredoxin-related protein